MDITETQKLINDHAKVLREGGFNGTEQDAYHVFKNFLIDYTLANLLPCLTDSTIDDIRTQLEYKL